MIGSESRQNFQYCQFSNEDFQQQALKTSCKSNKIEGTVKK
jgi:hypothetical protein